MNKTLVRCFIHLLGIFLAVNLWAGGSGYNVVVVVNQLSTNSVELGNYYRQMRNVPPQNFLRINWPGPFNEWTLTDFTNTLLNPLLTFLSTNKLTNQIDYVVLSMDIPYRINNTANANDNFDATSASLFYGFKSDSHNPSICEIAAGSTNLYAGSESIFRLTPPTSPNSNFFLVTMLCSSNNLALGESQVLQGVASDSTFPTNIVLLSKIGQLGYNARFVSFDNAVFDTRIQGNETLVRTNTATIFSSTLIDGIQTGAYSTGIQDVPPIFAPGSLVDNLNSFGGQFLESPFGETVILDFFRSGACGSYGTVSEPCSFIQKFPDPENYLYQARGFSMAESYYMSVTNPYQGTVAGEALAQPFAKPGTGAWTGLASNAVISGTTNLSVQFTASDAQHPLQMLDLFIDGLWVKTVTNIAPQANNMINVSLNGFATSLNVGANQTLKTVTSNLVNTLNGATYQNNTKVHATAHGDRIELQSTAGVAKTGRQISVSVSSTNSTGSLTTFIYAANASPTNFIDSIAQGFKTNEITGTILLTPTLTLNVTKTNNTTVSVTVTNNPGGTIGQLTQQLENAINANSSLQSSDGLFADDFETNANGSAALLNLYANAPGFAAAQINATISGSTGISVLSSGVATLTDNLNDLEPREHLYITAGAANLSATFPVVTTNQPDGYHELEAVAYEGSHVHTQTRATREIIIKNTTLTAALTPALHGTNTSDQPTLQFTVTANTNNIASIQLFSTGGLLASTSGQSSSIFSITFTNLGIGLHPFYAIVTDNSGHQYRTQTQNVGLVGVTFANSTLFGVDLPFPVQVSGAPPLLVWPATAGRAYNILSSANLLGPYQPRLQVVPTSSLGQWMETNTAPAQQFYRVSVAP